MSIVTSTLEQRGVLSSIRAQLRANVFSAIHEQQPPQPPPCAALKQLQQERQGKLAAQVRCAGVARAPSHLTRVPPAASSHS